jgi:hypothetical protein
MRTPSFKQINPSPRILKRRMRSLKRALVSNHLRLHFCVTHHNFNMRLWASDAERAIRLNTARLKQVKAEISSLRPERQRSRPRVKHDRRF